MTDADLMAVRPADPSRTLRAPRRTAWTVTVLLVVFMMVNFADKSVLGLAADPIRRDLHLSATAFGLANSAFFLLFSLCGAAVGLLADRVRPRWLLLAMAALWSVAQLPLALGGGVAMLITSRIILGAAEGPAFPVAQHAALSWFPDRMRNLPGALVTVGTTLGVAVAAPGLTWVVRQHGWRSAFGVVAVAGVVWAVLWAVFGGEGSHTDTTPAGDRVVTAEGADRTPAAMPKQAGYRRVLATRTWIGATAAYFPAYWVVALSLVWVPSYLHDGLGYSTTSAANLVALVWLASAVALLGQAGLTGWLLRRGVGSRWARARVGGTVLLMGALSCLALPVVPRGPLTVLLLVVAFGGAGVVTTVAVTTVAEFVPAAQRGGALGLMNAVVTTAGLVAPTLTGHLVDTEGATGYQNAMLLAGILLLLGGIAAFALIDPARDARRLAA